MGKPLKDLFQKPRSKRLGQRLPRLPGQHNPERWPVKPDQLPPDPPEAPSGEDLSALAMSELAASSSPETTSPRRSMSPQYLRALLNI